MNWSSQNLPSYKPTISDYLRECALNASDVIWVAFRKICYYLKIWNLIAENLHWTHVYSIKNYQEYKPLTKLSAKRYTDKTSGNNWKEIQIEHNSRTFKR